LVQHLEESRDRQGSGHYQIIHFDLHGGLLTYEQYSSAEPPPPDRHLYRGYAQRDIEAYEGQKAFLLFEGEKEGQPDLVSDDALADLLQGAPDSGGVLNACQSGKQVGDAETSLGHRLMQAGVQQVIAMGYSVTVSAAQQLMTALYRQLLAEKPLPQALRQGRLALYNDKARRAGFKQTHPAGRLAAAGGLPELRPVRGAGSPLPQRRKRRRPITIGWTPATPAPTPAYGFWGRDVDILEIEKRLLGDGSAANILLVQGMGARARRPCCSI
jgi:hypothetical protein